MYLTVLKAVMAKRDLNQADIARASGLSRQAVSLWFSSDGDFQNVHVATLMRLSASLAIDPAELLKPLPGMEGPLAVSRLATEFCWDRAYPDIYRFLAALADAEPRATARFIESRGIYAAASVSANGFGMTTPASGRSCHRSGVRKSMRYGGFIET